jgi:hypothetical protein
LTLTLVESTAGNLVGQSDNVFSTIKPTYKNNLNDYNLHIVILMISEHRESGKPNQTNNVFIKNKINPYDYLTNKKNQIITVPQESEVEPSNYNKEFEILKIVGIELQQYLIKPITNIIIEYLQVHINWHLLHTIKKHVDVASINATMDNNYEWLINKICCKEQEIFIFDNKSNVYVLDTINKKIVREFELSCDDFDDVHYYHLASVNAVISNLYNEMYVIFDYSSAYENECYTNTHEYIYVFDTESSKFLRKWDICNEDFIFTNMAIHTNIVTNEEKLYLETYYNILIFNPTNGKLLKSWSNIKHSLYHMTICDNILYYIRCNEHTHYNIYLCGINTMNTKDTKIISLEKYSNDKTNMGMIKHLEDMIIYNNIIYTINRATQYQCVDKYDMKGQYISSIKIDIKKEIISFIF